MNKCPDNGFGPAKCGGPDITSINKLPGGCFGGGVKDLFNRCDNIIDDTLNDAHNKMFGAQSQALRSFHCEIKCMSQDQLDEMKDTLVRRLGSDDSSQWDRNLLQKMYEITDAVAEHRQPPHVKDPFDVLPYKPHFTPKFEDFFKEVKPVYAGPSIKF
ncbi:MAG: hypothetical protein ACAI44_28250 [Candidatus Sericytochromatia bacterium]